MVSAKTEELTEPLLVGQVEAARILGVSKSLVKIMLRRGDLDGLHVGRRHLVKSASIRAYVARLSDEQNRRARNRKAAA